MTLEDTVKKIGKILEKNENFIDFLPQSDGYDFVVSEFYDMNKKDHEKELNSLLKKYNYKILGEGMDKRISKFDSSICSDVIVYHCGPNYRIFKKILKRAKSEIFKFEKNKIDNMLDRDIIKKLSSIISPSKFKKIMSFPKEKK